MKAADKPELAILPSPRVLSAHSLTSPLHRRHPHNCTYHRKMAEGRDEERDQVTTFSAAALLVDRMVALSY